MARPHPRQRVIYPDNSCRSRGDWQIDGRMAHPVFLIAGLGNPGEKYRRTRHNAGFLILEGMARRWNLGPSGNGKPQTQFSAEILRGRMRFSGGERGDEHTADIVLLAPQTFMNRSGQSVAPALKFYQLAPAERLLVVHDEVELAFADIRRKTGGGHKGHNGVRDIMAKLGGGDFERIRFGVGRPEHGSVADYSLSAFAKSEQAELEGLIDRAIDLAEEWLIERCSAR